MTLGDQFSGIMEAARAGEERALTALYLDTTPSLMRFLQAREPREAEDLCSEIWMQLARHLPRFEGSERQWWGFVFLVARRCLNDHWKRQKRRRTDSVAPDSLADLPSFVDVEASCVQSLATDEAVAFVTNCLTAEQADVVLLRVLVGLGVEEVATAVGKRPATVRVIQHRALRRLASRLSAGTQDAGDGYRALAAHPLVEWGEG
jgi:RNA polymerase sigma-70 factor (ECF subfamily)